MSRRLIRGRLVSFAAEPQGADDAGAVVHVEDGGVLVEAGRIAASGAWAEVRQLAGPDVPIVDHRPNLVLPGFVDPHIHFPQTQVVASYGTTLLDWLERYTFPEEARYADPTHAAAMAGRFLDEVIRHGTTTLSAFCSVHPASAEALFAAAEARSMRIAAGKVMMDSHAPAGVTDTAQSGYDDSKALIARWHGRGRALYAVTPRFALTSSPAQLAAAGALAAEHPDCLVQSHLAETAAEIARALALYPDAADYTHIYERHGLTGPRSLFGHCIHLSDREVAALADSGSVAVFCPTSNLFLGSGLFDRRRLKSAGVRTAVATDIGGGTSYSLLRTLDEGYKVLQLNRQSLDPLSSFWQATVGNAAAMGLAGTVGSLAAGGEADLVVLDARATPAMALRMETAESLADELFVLQTLGDDRAVAEVYIAGEPAKSRPASPCAPGMAGPDGGC